MARRYDVAELKGVERTPQGGLRVAANLTRTGVFSYRQADGSVRRELRHPDDVFNPASLATFKHAPITDLHPSSPVNPENYKQLEVGHVGEDVRPDGQFVAATLVIQDAEMVRAIEAKSRRELSMGYSVDLIPESGEYNGEAYDFRQTNVIANHCALGPPGWGRAGSDVSLRLDANDAEQVEASMKTIRIDGVDYELGSAQHLAKIDSMHAEKLAAEKARADAAEAKLVDATKLLATEKARADKAESELVKANDPKALHPLVQARLVVVDSFRRASAIALKREPDEAKRKARADADEAAAATSSDTALMLEAVKILAPDFDSSDEGEIRGAFKVVMAKLKETPGAAVEDDDAKKPEMDPAGDPMAAQSHSMPTQRGDSVYEARRGTTPRERELSPEERMHKDEADAWKRPLHASRDTNTRN